MSDLATLRFKDSNGDEVGKYQSAYVPRLGETVSLSGGSYRVVGVDWVYPHLESPSWQRDERGPIVQIDVEDAE